MNPASIFSYTLFCPFVLLSRVAAAEFVQLNPVIHVFIGVFAYLFGFLL